MFDKVVYLKIDAHVRYWDDAKINDERCDEDGSNIPFKNGESWRPIINLVDGTILNWPANTTGSFHFKVCDAGCYYLLDKDMNILFEIINDYIPSGVCHGDNGYGDYIIFDVDTEGKIKNYNYNINEDQWIDDCN